MNEGRWQALKDVNAAGDDPDLQWRRLPDVDQEPPLVVPPGAAQRICGHAVCGLGPCVWGMRRGLLYFYEAPWGWITSCDRCEAYYVDMLPEEHWEHAEHDG